MQQIIITIDTDWAPQEMIDYTIKVLDEYSIRATFFCTDDYPVIPKHHETAIHPNYMIEGRSKEETLKKIKEMYPDAIGIRSHSLLDSNRHVIMHEESGMKYQSNTLMFNCSGIKPYTKYGMVDFPLFFLDDYYAFHWKDINFSLKDLNIERDGLKVFAFHPIHIFMNTHSKRYYQEIIKPIYKDFRQLKDKRIQGPGIGKLFLELLQYIKDKSSKTRPLKDFYLEKKR